MVVSPVTPHVIDLRHQNRLPRGGAHHFMGREANFRSRMDTRGLEGRRCRGGHRVGAPPTRQLVECSFDLEDSISPLILSCGAVGVRIPVTGLPGAGTMSRGITEGRVGSDSGTHSFIQF